MSPLLLLIQLFFYLIFMVCAKSLQSCLPPCNTRDCVACQAPLSMGFSRQKYWNGLPRPAPGDIPNPGIKPMSLTSPALAGGFFTTSATWKAWSYVSVALCNPLDCSPPRSSVPGVFQARILEWVAISSS